MHDQQIRRLLEILERAAHEAQAVFTPGPIPDAPAGDTLTDPQRWARLLAHFVAAPDHSLTPTQVSHAAVASGYGDPRGVGALYNPRTNWLKSTGTRRVMTSVALDWFNTNGQQHLDGYHAENI
jgi:hypothetical protein